MVLPRHTEEKLKEETDCATHTFLCGLQSTWNFMYHHQHQPQRDESFSHLYYRSLSKVFSTSCSGKGSKFLSTWFFVSDFLQFLRCHSVSYLYDDEGT